MRAEMLELQKQVLEASRDETVAQRRGPRRLAHGVRAQLLTLDTESEAAADKLVAAADARAPPSGVDEAARQRTPPAPA